MPKSSQNFLDIAEIKQDTLVLKDGSLRAVLLCSSINFSLKSEDEQNALVNGYVNVLNTLEHPLQILVQSRKINIDNYLKDIEEKARVQTNDLLKMQTQDYINFVREIVDLGDIMTKRFYIVIPYNSVGETRESFFKRFFGIFTPTKVIKLRQERFLKLKSKLEKRVNNIESGFSSVGLGITRLDTQALIELFYSSYNPKIAKSQPLKDLKELQIE